MVDCGFSRIEEIDYNETFVPVENLIVIRVLLSLTASLYLHLHQLDVFTAFLRGDIEEDVFMKQLPGFGQGDLAKPVRKLSKALYGLKPAHIQYYSKLDGILITVLGMVRNPACDCTFIRIKEKEKPFISFYVDDLLIAYNCDSLLRCFKEELASVFKMKDLGETRNVLGVVIIRDRLRSQLY